MSQLQELLECLKDWPGSVTLGDRVYSSISEALQSGQDCIPAGSSIILHPVEERVSCERPERVELNCDKTYRITVKKYMTRKGTPEFDFMYKWNKDVPMPLITMVGTVEKETPGMVYMHLHGDITNKVTQRCLRCGKPITNPVSQFFGMGPECGQHNYVNPFSTDEELKEAVEEYRKNFLQKIEWTGWIIKSAIVEKEEIS